MSWRSGANIRSHFCQIEGMRVSIFTMRRNALQPARITQVSGTPGAHIPHYSGCVRRRLKSRDMIRASMACRHGISRHFFGVFVRCALRGQSFSMPYIFYVFCHNFKYLTTCLVLWECAPLFRPNCAWDFTPLFWVSVIGRQLMRALPVISITRVCAGILPKTKNATPCAA